MRRAAIELGLGRSVRSHEVDDPLEFDSRKIEFSLAQGNTRLRTGDALMAAMDGGARGRQLGLDLARIEAGKHVALVDVRALVDQDFSQSPGILAGDVDPLDLDPSIHSRQTCWNPVLRTEPIDIAAGHSSANQHGDDYNG